MSTLTKIRAEHIYVVPKTIKPSLKFTILATGIVCVTVVLRVYLLMVNIPTASKMVAKPTKVVRFAFLLTYAIPIIFESEMAPMQTPVRTAKTKLV